MFYGKWLEKGRKLARSKMEKECLINRFSLLKFLLKNQGIILILVKNELKLYVIYIIMGYP